jgi:hypothetical protein
LILILRPLFFGAELGFLPPLRRPFVGLEDSGFFFLGGGAFLTFGGGGGAFLTFGGGGGAFLTFGGGGGAFLTFGGGGGGGGGGGVFAMANASCKHGVPLKKSGGC